MQLAHQMREGRLAEDGSIVHDGLLAEVYRGVRLVQLVGHLVDEMVLLGDRDRCCPSQALRLLVFLILLAGDKGSSHGQQAEDDSLAHPDVVGTSGA